MWHCIGIFFVMAGLIPTWLHAQKKPKFKNAADLETKQRVFVTAGPDVGLVIPTDFGARINVRYQDTLFRLSPQVRFRLGMCVRTDFSKKFSFQTGIYYIERMYEAQVGKANATGSGIQSMIYNTSFKYIGFEIPLMGLFYVQLGERWFLNNLLGFSVEFFPSSVKSISSDTAVAYNVYGGRNSWIVPGVKAAVGFEYRTENAGYFYLGGQFHRPFFSIFDGFIERKNPEPYGLQTSELPASGTYFSIDLKYFFPPGKKNNFFER
jgi:hypothetical protein